MDLGCHYRPITMRNATPKRRIRERLKKIKILRDVLEMFRFLKAPRLIRNLIRTDKNGEIRHDLFTDMHGNTYLQDIFLRNQQLSQWLKNKKVIVVGPAPYLQGKNTGAWIDSHDVVVRMNHGWHLSAAQKKDYGSKVDMLYVNSAYTQIEEMAPLPHLKERSLQWVVFKDIILREESKRWHQEYIDHIHTTSFPLKMKEKLWPILRCGPNLGMLAIVHLLVLGVTSLTLTGFSLYQEKDPYYTGYRLSFVPTSEILDGHLYKPHKQAWRSLYNQRKIIVDEYLKNILLS